MTHRSIFAVAGIAAILVAAQARGDSPVPNAPIETGNHWREASLDDYRKHLNELTLIVEACSDARDLKTCDPTLVGPDDRVPVGQGAGAERRLVRYGWLRVLLSKAEDKDTEAPKAKAASGVQGKSADESAQPESRTTSELLKDAKTRLTLDLAQADRTSVPKPDHSFERGAMKQVLAERDFRNLEEPTARDSVLEKLGNWLNRIFESAAKFQSRSAWIGRVIVWGFILSVCVGLLWGLMQLERRWRTRLMSEPAAPATGTASARDWQLWLEDARKAAGEGLWREAIHFVYWASISRLESKRLWPADRARTPREYLALVALEDPRRAGLASLTVSFERIWYGGREAGERDYLRAEELASALISGRSATEGGAR